MGLLKIVLKSMLRSAGVGIINQRTLEGLYDYERDIADVLQMPTDKLTRLLELRDVAKAQLAQDLFVLSELEFKRDGFFVEFGATDGVSLSNTCVLEKEFGWRGILAELARPAARQSQMPHRNPVCVDEVRRDA